MLLRVHVCTAWHGQGWITSVRGGLLRWGERGLASRAVGYFGMGCFRVTFTIAERGLLRLFSFLLLPVLLSPFA